MKNKFEEFKIVSKLKNKFYYDYLPRFTSILTKLSTRKAKRLLKNKKTPKVLVDTQILFHSISHVACEISTGKRMWGGIEIDTYMTARIPVDYEKREFESVKYLPSIVSLANQNLINLYSSFELRDEKDSQPPRRYRPMRIGGYSLMQDVDIKLFDDPDYKFDFGSWINEPHKTHVEQRLERLSKKKDPLYLGLLSVLGQKIHKMFGT